MELKKHSAAAGIVFFIGVLSAGCASAPAAFPGGIDRGAYERYEVKGRGSITRPAGRFAFGPFTVDWTRDPIVVKRILHDSDPKHAEGEHVFSVTGEDGAAIKGHCWARAKWGTDTNVPNRLFFRPSKLVVENSLSCRLSSDTYRKFGFDIAVKKHLGPGVQYSSRKTGSEWGTVLGCYTIESVRRLEGAKEDAERDAGYYVRDTSGDLIAVIDVMNEGLVYLAKRLEPDKAAAFAAVSAALLLYRDPVE